ncbi:copper resistance protein CopC [Arthrobacter sp. BPSS-3]|uniref:copper resistance protein CopC n=1 Tax=Arthrobacter sp. BPSS-3 TaxID=3366580 RepID=UPI0037DD12BB
MKRRAPFRVTRALAAAGTALFLAAAAHLGAGGALPTPPVMAALAALAALTAAPLTARTMTAPILVGYLLAGQFALHHAFAALSVPAAPGGVPVAHVHGRTDVSFQGSVGRPGVPDAYPTDAMLGLHLLATLATALVLARAEATLWMLASWLKALIAPPAPAALPPVSRTAATGEGRRIHLGTSPGRVPARGPPRTAACSAVPDTLPTTQNCEHTMNLTHKKRTLLSVALATGLLIPAMAAGPAQAHDALRSTSPAADTTVTSTPETVSLTLSEPPTDSASLNLSVITVTDGEGKTISDGKVTVTGATISTKVTPGANGAHKVLWRAVSSDGHPIDGNYAFTVQNPSRTASAAPATPSPAQTSAPAAAGSTEVEPAKGPSNDNALLTLGVAAAVIAALAGILFLARRKRARNENS